ncbi:MAG: sigma-70 family RNA polymerase sigma factor [Anaerolineaceae bacterium]|nr:sigma-70 family RNA polymerase sigma factor [Anaerolineaceae bacterium]
MIEKTELPSHLKEMNQEEFGALVETHQRELRAHCYRMLGSVQEADEMVQETFWRAWDRRETFEGRSSMRAWLYKIATNLCIDTLRQRPRRGLPITRAPVASPDEPIPASIDEPIWLEPFPFDLPGPEDDNPEAKYTSKESIQLAFLASLHLLPPQQRAVLILRDVMGWRGDEVADVLGQTLPAVKSALHRARITLARQQSSAFSQIFAEPIHEETLRRQLDRYVKAWESADVDALVSLLRSDATFSMPPIPSWYAGRENIASLVVKTIFSGQASGRWRLTTTRANGQQAFGLYRLNPEKGIYDAYGVQVVTFNGDLIADIVTFRNPALLAYFDLPASLTA